MPSLQRASTDVVMCEIGTLIVCVIVDAHIGHTAG